MIKIIKTVILSLISLALISLPSAFAAEFVELFEEEYEEKYAPANDGFPTIYHHWQVKTQYGPRMLILVGGNNDYDMIHRTWLRKEWRKKHSMFLVNTEELADNLIVNVDVKQVHPIHKGFWNELISEQKAAGLQTGINQNEQ
ncbi:MAG: hypothetical protein K9L30_00635 [Desulfobacterales bacterium]|nr:hypothetical protein [Desulfobacterales bacterium]